MRVGQLVAAVGLMTGLGGATCRAQSMAKASGPVVIVVSLDGMPARALKDPRLPMPTLRKLAAEGAVAEGMVPINPAVTWPNHTTLITGVDASAHQVMANGLITFPAGKAQPEVKPWVPVPELVHAETLYQAAAAKGMTTGQVDWVAIYDAKDVRWAFGEKPDAEGEIAQDLIRDGAVTREQVEQFGEGASPAWRDQVWTDAAVDILEKHTPNLLLLHLLETDTLQHGYAPLTPAAYAAYAYADTCLKRVVDTVAASGLKDRATIFVVSDHGFSSYTHVIRSEVVLGNGGVRPGSVMVQPEGGAAEVFLRPGAGEDRAALAAKVAQLMSGTEGVERVVQGEGLRDMGLAQAPSTQAPDLYVLAKKDYSFGGGAKGPAVEQLHEARGAHGYVNSDPEMEEIFVAAGAAVKPGVKLPVFPNLRVAPTLARVLGVELPAAKAQPLLEMLR